MRTRCLSIIQQLRCTIPILFFWLTFNTVAIAAQPSAFSSWAKTATLAGAPVAVGMTPAAMNQMLDKMVKEGVTVVEADSDLSNYQSDAQFELELALMKQFADAAHQRGLRVVWYMPALEVITLDGKTRSDTMAKTHPDWVQIGLNGQQNVFYGGGGQVFWVAENAESAWMSPSSTGYRDYFFKRVQQMVTTGIDGLWADVPIYSDFGPTKWSDFNTEAVARFTADTGLSRPSREDWNDATWKRWVQWRHEELARFLSDLTQSARSINPEFAIFAETLPTDYNGGTVYGLDGSYLKNIEGLTEIWEVDTMSNNVGMRNARNDDWISFISALKYTRAATGDKPSWVFSYGKQPDDAQQVMTQALMTGNNPYELQVPEMASSVGTEFRSRLFNWSKAYSPYLFKTTSNAKTGILYSSASRDYVDKFSGLGMFATTEANGDSLWWAGSENESVYQRDYLAEHRGILKVLVNEHIPFNVLVHPDAAELNRYKTLFLPNVEAISDAEANLLKSFVQQGGNLIVTGPNPTGLDQYGASRDNYALADLLGFNKADTAPLEKVHSFGAGQTHYYAQRLGKQYLTQKDVKARTTLSKIVRDNTPIDVETDANDSIYIESTQLAGYSVLQFANFIGMKGSFSIEASRFKVGYQIPAGKTVRSVSVTTPDSNNKDKTALAFTQTGTTINFDLSINQYAMVLIEFEGASQPIDNHPPVAGDDELRTPAGTALTFTQQSLLSNDGDLDGDTLSITQVDIISSSGSSLRNQQGSYTYTPAADFSGVDTLMYTVSDGKGATDTALVDIYINSTAKRYFPTEITPLNASPYGDPLIHFTNIDDKTYDIAAKPLEGKKVVDWVASTTIDEAASDIGKIKIWHMGQYSINNIQQTAYLYNFQSNAWELIDTATVSNEGGYPLSSTISDNLSRYISPQKQLKLRIKGVDNSADFNSWSEQLYWEISAGTGNGGGTGKPDTPTATPQNLSTLQDKSLSIQVSGSDPQGKNLTYQLSQAPQQGKLTGTLPNVSYQPNDAYVGKDSFSFTVSNGTKTSAAASISIFVRPDTPDTSPPTSASNPVSSVRLSMDGDLKDWRQLNSFGQDGADITANQPKADWLEAWMAHNENNLYLAYRNDGRIDQSKWWLWAIYLDTDNDHTTGFKIHKKMGVDYFFNGSSLWKYTGTGLNWSWDVVIKKVQHTLNNDVAELTIPLSFIKPNKTMRVLFQADNLVTKNGKESSIIDRYPNKTDGYFNYHFSFDKQPIAYHDALSMVKNSAADIMLLAKDSAANVLSYKITSMPKQGQLTGMGSNRRYVPNADFVGQDQFSFKVNNGMEDSAEAIVNITVVKGPPSNTVKKITLDGDLTEWKDIAAFAEDGHDIIAPNAGVDWMKAQLSHNADTLYLAYENYSAIDMNKWWLWETYFDIDQNNKTGYRFDTKLGAEYVLQGRSLYRYTGAGTDWQWSVVKELKTGVMGKFAEIAIPRNLLNNPTQLRVAFFGNNASYVENPNRYPNAAIDFYPEHLVGYFQYQLK